MKILIIEDDKQLASIMHQWLTQNGFLVTTVHTATAGEELAFVEQYDVILLDINLPDKDGQEVLQFLRTESIDTPIIIISARDQVRDRTQGLDDGADDYLIKSFDFDELIARIHAVVRRFQGRAKPTIIIGDLEINPSTRRIALNQQEILLSAREYYILEYLAMRHPQVVTSEELLRELYGENYNENSSVLRVHIANLRKKIANEQYIKTLKGRGYRLCLID